MVAFPNAVSRLDSSGTKFSFSFIHLSKEYLLFTSVPITVVKNGREFYLPRVQNTKTKNIFKEGKYPQYY